MDKLIIGLIAGVGILALVPRARATGLLGAGSYPSGPPGPVTVRMAPGRSVTIPASEAAQQWAALRSGMTLGEAVARVDEAWACNDTQGLEFVWGNGAWDPTRPPIEVLLHQAVGARSGRCVSRVYKGGVLRRLPGIGSALSQISSFLRFDTRPRPTCCARGGAGRGGCRCNG